MTNQFVLSPDEPEACGDIDPESGLACGRAPHYGFHHHVLPDGGHRSWGDGFSTLTPADRGGRDHTVTDPDVPDTVRTTPDNPPTSTDTVDNSDDGLRDRYVAAIRQLALSLVGAIDKRDVYDLAAAVLDVRDDAYQDLAGRLLATEAQRDLAIAHDRQPYPTAWAYEQACTALETHRRRAGDLAEEHDVHRKAVAVAIDMTLDRNWEQLIEGAARLHQAAGEWMADAQTAAARAEEAEATIGRVRQLLAEPRSLIDRTRLADAINRKGTDHA